MSLFYTVTLQEMPVFEPNDYFWQNHWDQKEEKWVAYARAVQTIIAEQKGAKVSQSWMEDKLEYKKLLRPKKEKKEK